MYRLWGFENHLYGNRVTGFRMLPGRLPDTAYVRDPRPAPPFVSITGPWMEIVPHHTGLRSGRCACERCPGEVFSGHVLLAIRSAKNQMCAGSRLFDTCSLYNSSLALQIQLLFLIEYATYRQCTSVLQWTLKPRSC